MMTMETKPYRYPSRIITTKMTKNVGVQTYDVIKVEEFKYKDGYVKQYNKYIHMDLKLNN